MIESHKTILLNDLLKELYLKMPIIADNRIPPKAKRKLKEFAEVLFFETKAITYPAISCHPDIFMVKNKNGLIVAPNLPPEMKNILTKNKIFIKEGNSQVGSIYPKTATYNAVITSKYLIHNLQYTDSFLLEMATGLEQIHVNQAYTQCNMLVLNDNHCITSDLGIQKVLKKHGWFVHYINPAEIILPGMKNGFFGGCCGINGNTVFIIGNLDFVKEGKAARKFIEDLGYKIVELYDGTLFDGGGLIMIEE